MDSPTSTQRRSPLIRRVAIRTYLPRILRQVDTLAHLIASHGDKPTLVNDVLAWYSFDSMGEFLFDKSFDMMTSSEWHPIVLQQRNALSLLGMISESLWLARLGFAFLPFYGIIKDWMQVEAFCKQRMIQRMEVSKPARCSMEYRLTYHGSVLLKIERILPPGLSKSIISLQPPKVFPKGSTYSLETPLRLW